ncbi:uncharacterized protein Z519_07366 [Cladophialophora bantiana CBS 173.52]|uniref:A-kinase anchor protein 7-like phosphoesterase domain-containing protein n=1 Tax=Cladophialophora bantiana (strain ATCC 10958 / CBS 173.52 / CDC B-1940 / NIH 8579) TaxID=1442370 RepID=A0A0D2G0W2_CLAB1|nr:uncharacterized protein Z519_07366 [Cladophialophora bantiana CBS 173.52]KIW92382.1 hypothetical protein Z519_07366 [Cladophialophora bantiana CBS 173.52]
MTSVEPPTTPPSGQAQLGLQPSQPASTLQAPVAPSKKLLEKKPINPRHNKQPTHFVCFPLVSDESVAQLSKSLAYFRSLTTPLPPANRDVTPEEGAGGGEANAEPAAPEQSNNEIRGRDVDQAVRVIPESAHRPPGTFHLTLGTMHLPDAEHLEKAVALLQEIDYVELLRQAESGEGNEAHKFGRGRRVKKTPKGGIGGDSNEVTQARDETQSEREGESGRLLSAAENIMPPMEQEKAESLSATKGNQNQNSGAHRDVETLSTVEEQADSEHLQETDNPQLSTATSNHAPEDSGKLRETARQVGAVPSSPLQSLKSLSREISPPAVSAPSTLTQDFGELDPPQPISVSLSSLGTFPSSRSARVFFAHPHDPTARLHRFGNLVRDVFREAGLVTETRPLVLHATVANLIYVKGRKGSGKGRGGRGRNGNKKAEDGGNVDAREILRFFNHGPNPNGNQNRRASSPPPRSAPAEVNDRGDEPAAPTMMSRTIRQTNPAEGVTTGNQTLDPALSPNPTDKTGTKSEQSPQIQTPFIWARDITIRSIRICKMGAEPSPTPGWGLEYRPVAEKVFMAGQTPE